MERVNLGIGGRPPQPLQRPHRRTGDVVARSRAADRADALGSDQEKKTIERILRYPNGDTRRIRYPIAESEDEQDWDASGDDLFWATPESRKNALQPAQAVAADSKSKQTELPSSPAELIRYLNSHEYRQAQKELRQRIRASYEIMEGCPWVVSRSLYIIAVCEEGDGGHELTYSLPTRVARTRAARDLSKMLNKEDVFNIGEVLDGVITFNNPDDCERFRSNLEAEGHHQVTQYEVDAHELFRNTRDAKAVVVLMDCSDYFPYPLELGTSLRDHTSLEDDTWRA